VNKFVAWISIGPISKGQTFEIEFAFHLPRVMYLENDYDAIGISRFQRGVDRFEYVVRLAYLPVEPLCYAIHSDGPTDLGTMEASKEPEFYVLSKKVERPADLDLGFLFHYRRLESL
jgi:hypothetical protein